MEKVVFCDFDGTITVEETFVAFIKVFAPEITAQLVPEMYALRLTLRQGVRRILETIPSSRYPEIIEFSRSKVMRPGFVELLDFLAAQGVPLVVVSGGLRGIVEVILGDLAQRVTAIHALDIDASGQYLQAISEFEGETDLVDKVQVMRRYSCQQAIAIGDSLTDLNMGMAADLVFARDRLADYLQERQKPYIHWDNFFEIRDYLAQKAEG